MPTVRVTSQEPLYPRAGCGAKNKLMPRKISCYNTGLKRVQQALNLHYMYILRCSTYITWTLFFVFFNVPLMAGINENSNVSPKIITRVQHYYN